MQSAAEDPLSSLVLCFLSLFFHLAEPLGVGCRLLFVLEAATYVAGDKGQMGKILLHTPHNSRLELSATSGDGDGSKLG